MSDEVNVKGFIAYTPKPLKSINDLFPENSIMKPGQTPVANRANLTIEQEEAYEVEIKSEEGKIVLTRPEGLDAPANYLDCLTDKATDEEAMEII